MDLTESFRSAVSALESKPDLEPPSKDIKRILRKKRPKDSFESRARDVVTAVSGLHDFLLDNRDAYLDVLGDRMADAAGGGSAVATGDLARDKIDAGANQYIQTCNGLIRQLRSDLKATTVEEIGSESRARHLESVCQLLDSHLKRVCGVYAEQQAIRVQREIEFQKMARLESKAKRESESEEATLEERERQVRLRMEEEEDERRKLLEEEEEEHEGDEGVLEAEGEHLHARLEGGGEEGQGRSQGPSALDDDGGEEFTAEEVQVLEQENARLYEDLVSVQDAVQQVENKVVKIAELQEVFTEKVLQQAGDIELIGRNAVTATENVKDGNEELRRAIQNQASVRVYVLFFLLVMSFSLLFLDWYNE